MDSFKTFFFLLKKGREVVIGGTRLKTLSIKRKPDFKFVSIDVKPSAGFKRKANPTEGGKWKIVICYWNMDNDGKAIINSSSF